LSNYLLKLQVHLEKLQKIFEPKSRVANVVSTELSYLEVCRKRKENAKEYMTNVMCARVKDDEFLILDCSFSAQKLSDVSVVTTSLDGLKSARMQYKMVGVPGSKKNKKFVRFGCTPQTLVSQLKEFERSCRAILFYDSKLDLKILAKTGFVPSIPVYDVQKMVALFDTRDPVLQTEQLGLISALKQIWGPKYVSKGTDAEMVGQLFHCYVDQYILKVANGCEGPYVMEQWLKSNPSELPAVIYL